MREESASRKQMDGEGAGVSSQRKGLVDLDVFCHCGLKARLWDARILYVTNDFGSVWVCENYPRCDSYVGAHRKSRKPKGTLAGPNLRQLRRKAHALFDNLWTSGRMSRKEAYAWLQCKMRVAKADAHIGFFNETMCERLIAIMQDVSASPPQERPQLPNPVLPPPVPKHPDL